MQRCGLRDDTARRLPNSFGASADATAMSWPVGILTEVNRTAATLAWVDRVDCSNLRRLADLQSWLWVTRASSAS